MTVDGLLSVRQAAERYGIPTRTLYTAITRGKLASRRIGAQFVLTPDAVQDWLRFARHTPGRRKRQESGPPPPTQEPQS